MFREMIELAREWGVEQLELEYMEGNERGIRLYEKMGFRTVAELPHAIRLRDGTYLREFTMIKTL
jgi:ribosomal protein S18 acetylase RimI-like enzyme